MEDQLEKGQTPLTENWIRTRPTDVFIRTKTNQSALRDRMSQLCHVRWNFEPVDINYLDDMGIREGRQFAEQTALSDPYIVTDDDVLLVGKDWVNRAVKAMLGHPEYRACSTLSLVEGENQATGEGEIYEMHAVGAPMIIRKGTMVDLPDMDLNNECGTIHKMILDRGGKEGLINGLRHNHLGHGFSSNPALFWGY